jgi:diaminohydroxyphosphoribosylaminopyrimidine deaminase/5-amino-6-(5-phosphoribosylamino)uracil reductase|tara:strand:- start:3023 stop:4120 length:1098 start_codon:yes stop_codon:yes gene_type:complete
MVDDAHFMARAIRLAEKGLYTSDPNPRVGCILVKDDCVVGEGFHLTSGESHAEANAIAEAGDAARGATAYVTLEPCSFQGRTPSCATALVAAGVKRVVAAMADPHERNAGAGYRILQDAGIELTTTLLESAARKLNPGHVKRYETGLPYVRLKLAMSLDGKTALANGDSQWITGEEARRDVQKLRARSSAIVTGVQTIIDDDPRLTVRAQELDAEHSELAAARKRPVYVLDSKLRVPAHAKIVNSPENVLVSVAGTAAGNSFNCRLLAVDGDGTGCVHLSRFLQHLALEDCNEVLFECGPTLGGSLVEQGLCDEIVIYMAPKIMGSGARSLLKVSEIDTMGDLFNMNITDFRFIGDDIRITAVPN